MAGATMADWGWGLQFSGMASSALGAYFGAEGQKSALSARATIADINATTARRSAQSALEAGQLEEQRSGLATANLKSAQQAQFASNGVALGEGSAARVLTSTDVMGAIDKNTIAANAVRAAWGYRTQATNQNIEGIMDRGAADGISPLSSGVSSLLGSAGGVASNWYQLNKAGALGAFGSTPSVSMGTPQAGA